MISVGGVPGGRLLTLACGFQQNPLPTFDICLLTFDIGPQLKKAQCSTWNIEPESPLFFILHPSSSPLLLNLHPQPLQYLIELIQTPILNHQLPLPLLT